jgi:hypothetical protein
VHAVWDYTSKNLSALLGVAMMRVIGPRYLESYFKKVYDRPVTSSGLPAGHPAWRVVSGATALEYCAPACRDSLRDRLPARSSGGRWPLRRATRDQHCHSGPIGSAPDTNIWGTQLGLPGEPVPLT